MRRIAVFALALALTGCGSSESAKVVSSVNAFYYYNARYEEKCVEVVGPMKECSATAAALARWKKGLAEADAAVQRGGKLPLQVGHLTLVQKETKKCLPR